MPSKPKTARREHSPETIAVILALDSIGYSIRQIRKENGLAKSTIHGIIRRAVRNPDAPYRKARRTGRPPKLDERAERRLIRFIGLNPFETIASYSTPSKSGYLMHLNTTRRYLKKNEIYAFRPRKKPYLSKAHKRFRLKWAKEHQFWEVEDWACVAWSDEATFEIGLDTTPPWVRRPKGKAYESQYLKPTFKSGRSAVGIWGCISLDFKGSLVILSKGARMNSTRYYNTILNDYVYPFYEKLTHEKGCAL
jgi:hypothetical protein